MMHTKKGTSFKCWKEESSSLRISAIWVALVVFLLWTQGTRDKTYICREWAVFCWRQMELVSEAERWGQALRWKWPLEGWGDSKTSVYGFWETWKYFGILFKLLFCWWNTKTQSNQLCTNMTTLHWGNSIRRELSFLHIRLTLYTVCTVLYCVNKVECHAISAVPRICVVSLRTSFWQGANMSKPCQICVLDKRGYLQWTPQKGHQRGRSDKIAW